MTSVDSDPKSFDQVLCAQSWVESCSKVKVDFRSVKFKMKTEIKRYLNLEKLENQV